MFKRLTQRVLEPSALGFDISEQTAKFCQFVRQGGRIRMATFGEIAIPPGTIKNGEIKDEEILRNAILEKSSAFSKSLFGERFCVASLPEEKSFVRVIELPIMSAKDLKHAVRWEVEGVVPLPAEDIFYDYELAPAKPGSDHCDVLITAFPRTIIESYHRVLSAAGFIPLALELESQATSRAILAPALRTRSIIIVNIGRTRTHFTMIAGGAIVFTKTIAIGGIAFEKAISDKLEVPLDEAVNLKIEIGFDRSYAGGGLARALEPLIRSITDELTEHLWFFRDHIARRHSLKDIEMILLAGGDANLIGLEKYIATTVKKPTELGDPFVNTGLDSGEIPPISRSESLKYATAIGLGLRTFDA